MIVKKWKKLCKGIRYYENNSRTITSPTGKRPDRYYSVRWTRNGKTIEEGIGWESEGISEDKIIFDYQRLRLNYKNGKKPTTFKEEKIINEEIEAKKQAEKQEAKDKSITINEFFYDYFIPWKRDELKIKSWKVEQQRFELRAKSALGKVPLHKVTPKMLTDFMKTLYAENLRDATILLHMAIIRQIFNKAKKTYLDTGPAFKGDSPVSYIDLPKIGRRNARTGKLTLALFEMVLAGCLNKAEEETRAEQKKTWYDLFDALVLAAYSGLRFGEIQRLKWGNVDFDKRIIIIEEQKNQTKNQEAPLPQPAEYVLLDRGLYAEDNSNNQLVFPPYRKVRRQSAKENPKKEILSKDNDDKNTQKKDQDKGGNKKNDPQYNTLLSRKFTKLLGELEINTKETDHLDKIIFHSLRHTYASWLSSKNVPLIEIKNLMRHKSIEMTLRYTHSIEEEKHKFVDKLDSFDYDKVFNKTSNNSHEDSSE